MANMLFANNCNTTLNGGITAVATSMVVTSATGFPAPTGSQYFYCTLADAATQTTIEIVKVTAVSGTTFTIVRGQDGTTGTIFASGAVVSLRLVRANLNDFPKLDEDNTFSGTITFSTPLLATNMIQSTTSTSGYLSSTDWNTFNGKAPAFTYTTGYVPFGQGTTTPNQDSALFWDNTNKRLGIGTTSPASLLDIYSATAGYAGVGLQGYSTATKWYLLSGISGININPFSISQNANGTSPALCIYGSGGVSIGNTTDAGAGNLRFSTTNTNGIYFGSSSKLADYEEGTFTPSFTGSGGNPSVTYTLQSGKYFKVGNQVTVFIGLVTSAASGGSGNLGVAGLPYTVGGAPNNLTSISFAYNFAANYPQAFGISGTSCVLYSAPNGNNNAQSPLSTLTSSGSVYFYAAATYTVI